MTNKLNTLKIGFGESKNSPIQLTEEELNTLLKVIADENITDKSFNGFITSDISIKSSQVYTLGINGITYVGDVEVDGFDVVAEVSVVKPGGSVKFNATGVDSSVLKFELLSLSNTTGTIDTNIIKNKIRFVGNTMYVDDIADYSGWKTTATIRCTTKYDSTEYHDINITIRSKIKPTSITITGPDKLSNGVNSFDVNKIPSDSDMNITSLDVTYKKIVEIISTVTINQSGTIDDPAQMITGDIGINGTPEDNAFAWVYANAHGYVGTYDKVNHVMNLKQLDDLTHRKYKDGTDTSLDKYNNDVFIKLPKFWFNVIIDGGNLSITFSQKAKPGFIEWDDTQLIGKYEATVENNIVKSILSNASTGNISWENFFAYTRAMSDGDNHFRMITIEAHTIIQLLFYGYMGTTNAQAVCGTGADSYTRKLGTSDYTGMRYTSAPNGESCTIFCGLENWWGDKYEWLDNIMTSDANRNCKIFDYSTTKYTASSIAKETINIPVTGGCISKLGFKNGILYPIAQNGSDYSKHYVDYGDVSASSGFVGARSYRSAFLDGGVGFLYVGFSVSDAYASVGSRLLYHGAINIVD